MCFAQKLETRNPLLIISGSSEIKHMLLDKYKSKIGLLYFFQKINFSLSQSAFFQVSTTKCTRVHAFLLYVLISYGYPVRVFFLSATPKILDYYGNKVQYFKHHATIKVTG